MIKLILANKPKYLATLEGVLEKALGNAELLRQPSIVWFLLADSTGVVGLAYAYQVSDVRMYVNLKNLRSRRARVSDAGDANSLS